MPVQVRETAATASVLEMKPRKPLAETSPQARDFESPTIERPDTERPRVPAEPLNTTPVEDETSHGSGEAGPPRSRRWMGIAIGALFVAAAAVGGYVYVENGSHFVSTDDAFVAARQYAVSPKVSGYVVAVPVSDNQHVNAGDVIARLDDRDYRVSLAQAQAQIAAAEASIGSAEAQINAQQAQVDLYQANVEQADANLTFARQQASRYDSLAQNGSGSVQNAQQYSAQLRQQEAAMKSAQASVASAKQQLGALVAQRANAEASLAQANAQRDQAQLNLSYTTVTAAQSGRVVQLSASVGQLAQAGANLAILVPDEIWVTANFKETQLETMKPGQPVTLDVDAYPQHEFKGHLDSVQPGSGTAFSLLPAENATGNYVKIVQRVPVKIVLDNPPSNLPLGPGMSVVPVVRTNPAPSLIERLRSAL